LITQAADSICSVEPVTLAVSASAAECPSWAMGLNRRLSDGRLGYDGGKGTGSRGRTDACQTAGWNTMGEKAQAAGAGSGRLELASKSCQRQPEIHRLRYRASYQVITGNAAYHRDRVPRPQGRLCRDAGSAGPSESRNGPVDGDPGAAGALAKASVTAACANANGSLGSQLAAPVPPAARLVQRARGCARWFRRTTH
jgi:hypothetical protein